MDGDVIRIVLIAYAVVIGIAALVVGILVGAVLCWVF